MVYLVLLCNVLTLVDINLEEDHIVHGLVHLLQVRGDHLAGAAPGGVEVHNHQLATSAGQLLDWDGQDIRVRPAIGAEH